MFNILIIPQAEIETRTQTKDQIIHDFAFFVLSSSHHENKYINPLIINAITAITATNCITCHMIFVIRSKPILFPTDPADGDIGFASLQPGNQTQFTDGTEANVEVYDKNIDDITIKFFFNIFK